MQDESNTADTAPDPIGTLIGVRDYQPQPGERIRHHYLPQGLMRPWIDESSGTNTVLVCSALPDNRVVFGKPQSPKSINFADHLYTLAFHGTGNDHLETAFFGTLDNDGLAIRKKIVEVGTSALSEVERRRFAEFLFSLHVRSPQIFPTLKVYSVNVTARAFLKGAITDNWRAAFSQEKRDIIGDAIEVMSLNDALLIVTMHAMIADHVHNFSMMKLPWNILPVSISEAQFVLSDAPLMTYIDRNTGDMGCVCAMAPTCALVVSAQRQFDFWRTRSPKFATRHYNSHVISQANKKIVVYDDRVKRFVERTWTDALRRRLYKEPDDPLEEVRVAFLDVKIREEALARLGLPTDYREKGLLDDGKAEGGLSASLF